MIGQYVTVHGDVISHVNISHVVVEDGGEYTCNAENRAGKVTHSARLNVYGKMKYNILYLYHTNFYGGYVRLYVIPSMCIYLCIAIYLSTSRISYTLMYIYRATVYFHISYPSNTTLLFYSWVHQASVASPKFAFGYSISDTNERSNGILIIRLTAAYTILQFDTL